jgi:hypothetical protein
MRKGSRRMKTGSRKYRNSKKYRNSRKIKGGTSPLDDKVPPPPDLQDSTAKYGTRNPLVAENYPHISTAMVFSNSNQMRGQEIANQQAKKIKHAKEIANAKADANANKEREMKHIQKFRILRDNYENKHALFIIELKKLMNDPNDRESLIKHIVLTYLVDKKMTDFSDSQQMLDLLYDFPEVYEDIMIELSKNPEIQSKIALLKQLHNEFKFALHALFFLNGRNSGP